MYDIVVRSSRSLSHLLMSFLSRLESFFGTVHWTTNVAQPLDIGIHDCALVDFCTIVLCYMIVCLFYFITALH